MCPGYTKTTNSGRKSENNFGGWKLAIMQTFNVVSRLGILVLRDHEIFDRDKWV